LGAGQPAADRENVDRGPTQETVVSELEHPATPAPTDDADARVTVPPGNAVNGEGDHPPTDGPNAYVPRMPPTEDELRNDDPLLQSFTGADRKLHGVFGDTIHHNDGRHLDGGVGKDEDRKWQRLHERVVAASLPLYSLPNGRWAKRFLKLQTALWTDVRERGCNSEKACVFAPLILRQVRSKKTMSEVKTLVWSRMDAWEAGRYCALVKEVEECSMHQKQHHVPYSLAISINGTFLLIHGIASTLWAFQYVFLIIYFQYFLFLVIFSCPSETVPYLRNYSFRKFGLPSTLIFLYFHLI
jgi:hypothetical protein